MPVLSGRIVRNEPAVVVIVPGQHPETERGGPDRLSRLIVAWPPSQIGNSIYLNQRDPLMPFASFLIAGSLLLSCLMVIIGFFAGLWYAAPASLRSSDSIVPDPDSSNDAAIQRVRFVAAALIRLAQNVAGDVSNHSTKIEAISADLTAAHHLQPELRSLVEKAPDRILAANLELQKQLSQARQQIEHLADQLRARESEARTDPLTTLYNRRALTEEMTRLLSLWERKGFPFSFLMLDIDHFKRFNDTYGHQVGDAILGEVARIISGQLRGMDVAFRYGGEEFAVLLPSTEPRDASVVAERIRAAIEETAITSANTRLTATTSVGVAHAIQFDRSNELVRRADEALYAAKRAGRNCVRWHNGTEIITFGAPQSSTTRNRPAESGSRRSKPNTLSAFNYELTRRVCDCRQFDTTLSLVCIRATICDGAGITGEATSADNVLPALIDFLRHNLTDDDFITPVGAAELMIILPGRTTNQALRFLATLIQSNEGREFQESHPSNLLYKACQLLPSETAEQLLVRTRKCLLATTESIDDVVLGIAIGTS